MIINVPAALGLALLSEPITRLLFQRGEFHASDTALMTPILAVYALGRSLRVVAPETEDAKLPWDTPVPFEHSFECTLANVSAMAAPYLVLDDAVGVSLGWMLPGWGALLARTPT